MEESHDFHVERNPYNPDCQKPWLVENSLNCVVSRHETEEEAISEMRHLNHGAAMDLTG